MHIILSSSPDLTPWTIKADLSALSPDLIHRHSLHSTHLDSVHTKVIISRLTCKGRLQAELISAPAQCPIVIGPGAVFSLQPGALPADRLSADATVKDAVAQVTVVQVSHVATTHWATEYASGHLERVVCPNCPADTSPYTLLPPQEVASHLSTLTSAIVEQATGDRLSILLRSECLREATMDGRQLPGGGSLVSPGSYHTCAVLCSPEI